MIRKYFNIYLSIKIISKSKYFIFKVIIDNCCRRMLKFFVRTQGRYGRPHETVV